MKKISFLIPKLLLLSFAALMLVSCIKNDNIIDGDAKVKFHNSVQTGVAQDFFFNGVSYTSALTYGSSTDYVIIPIRGKNTGQEYTIISKNTKTINATDTIKETLKIGKNYSIFYKKTSDKDSSMFFHEDDVSINVDSANLAKLQFINLGYTLKGKVNIYNLNKKYNRTLSNGEMTEYIYVPIDLNAKVFLKIIDSAKIDTITASSFIKGKTYTILIDGSKTGVLQQRLISN